VTTNRRQLLFGAGAAAIVYPLACQASESSRPWKDCLATRRGALSEVLGIMPKRPSPHVRVLETVSIAGGQRLKIEYLAEEADPFFREPPDLIRAYLFVPPHQPGAKYPAIVAIHQDGSQSHLGKLETAGLAGDKNLHYGLDLFQRGYVVLCPDRFGHAERRRGVAQDSVDPERDQDLLNHRVGQLLLKGRTMMGKEAYDCMVAADVLLGLPYVDTNRLGAIGHSAGGNALVYWMYLDTRPRGGVSSCGYFDMLRFFREDAPKRRMAGIAPPRLALAGQSADYLAGVAPRPLLLTRGLWEWGTEGQDGIFSRDHVQETKDMVKAASDCYEANGSRDKLKALYFDEDGGNHDFPPGIREQAYLWLDEFVKRQTT
jgi:dienelactone hydrolase